MYHEYRGKEQCKYKQCGTCKHFINCNRKVNMGFSGYDLKVTVNQEGKCKNVWWDDKQSGRQFDDHCPSHVLDDDIAKEIKKIEDKEKQTRIEQEKKSQQQNQKSKGMGGAILGSIGASILEHKNTKSIKFAGSVNEDDNTTSAVSREKKIKNWWIVGAVVALITIIIISVCVSNAIKNKKEKEEWLNSPTYKISSYINKNGSNNCMSKTYLVDGVNVEYSIKYFPEGTSVYEDTYSFQVVVNIPPKSTSTYDECYGIIKFNYGDFKHSDIRGEVHDGTRIVYPIFHNNTYGSCPNITNVGYYWSYGGYGDITDLEEATNDSWEAVKIAIELTQNILKNQINASYTLW